MADKSGKSGWTDREIMICLLNAIETNGVKLDFNSIGYPQGRSASGFTQKLTALKKALKPELDAINASQPVPEAPATPKKTPGRKRKAESDDDNGEMETPKKRGRAKKQPPKDTGSESPAKDEPEGELSLEVEKEI